MNSIKNYIIYSISFIFVIIMSVDLHGQSVKSDPVVSFPTPWTSPYVVDPDHPHHFVNRDGNHLYLYNKSAFAYFNCKNPTEVLNKAKKIGANVIRVCLEGKPFYNNLKLDMWPWGGTRTNPNWNTFNETYWAKVEDRIKLAGENGIGLDIIVYYSLLPTEEDIANQSIYWKYIISRLGKYSNVFSWEIMYTNNTQKKIIDVAGSFFKSHDPFNRPVFSSGPGSDDAFIPEKPWMDVSVVQTPTGNQPEYKLREWYLAVAKNVYGHGKPAFNLQPGREMVDENDDPVFRRKQSWLWCASGAYWTWHSYDGCEGINEVNYYSPGWQYSKPISTFFNTIPFWSMNPNYTACQIDKSELVITSMATPDRNTVVTYACSTEQTAFVRNSTMTLRLQNGEYQVYFIRPSDLKKIKSIDVHSSGPNNLLEIGLPDFNDDILISITKK